MPGLIPFTRAQAVVVLGAIAVTYHRNATSWPDDGRGEAYREAERELVDAICEAWPELVDEYKGVPPVMEWKARYHG